MTTELDDRLRARAAQEQAEAVELYRLAARQGVAGAQCRLGMMYAEGRGVARDDAEAARWFRLAAEQGEPEAQGGLALACAAGRGVPRDLVAAHKWLSLAAGRLTGETLQRAQQFRAALATAMSAAQLADAERQARAWRPGPGAAVNGP